MADTSRRALRLLSLLGSGRRWSLGELAARLDVSERTVRRDIETLRQLDYPIGTDRGPSGGYRWRADKEMPPLRLDAEQMLAVAVALQTSPGSVFGLADDAARALVTITQAMPAPLRSTIESLQLTKLQNYWEFPAPPIEPRSLTIVGSAVRQRHVLLIEQLRTDGSRPAPQDDDFMPPRRTEPHHLVVWAGRWYLVSRDQADLSWRVHRLDRLHCQPSTGISFTRQVVPGGDVAHFVMTSHERGDTPAAWECLGSARLDLPAEIVARWAPGGSVVEHLGARRCRLTLGAWSWAGVAGILATFDADIADVEPPELIQACRRLIRRWEAVGG